MKKCPTCSKEFPDSMRFCQTDGTPLLEIVETPPVEDPYKTTVGKPEDFASLIPPEDPFKTVVGGAPKSDESGDLLQLPEEHDPLKTSFIPEAQLRAELKLDEPKQEEPQDIFPPLPSPDDFVEAEPPKQYEPPVFNVPEPPKFNEPSITPPPFDWSNSSADEEKKEAVAENVPTFDTSPPPIEPDDSEPPTLISEPFQFDPPPPPKEEPPKFEAPKFDPPKAETGNDSPFNSPFNTPIPSPFDDAKPSKYEAPSTPLPSFKEPEPIIETSANDPFAPTPFGQANDPFNQPVKQNDWTPPPAPEANWQNQNIGQNTPFQPPPAGTGQNQTLAIVSLVLGILSIFCCGWILPGVIAVVLGFMAKSKAEQNPNEYGGRGLALGGIITGGISVVLGIVVIILYLFTGLLAGFGNI